MAQICYRYFLTNNKDNKKHLELNNFHQKYFMTAFLTVRNNNKSVPVFCTAAEYAK